MIKSRNRIKVGADCGEGPPVPIPNTEVKLTCAENTWRAAAWENRKAPTQRDTQRNLCVFLFKSIKQRSENHSAVESFTRQI